MLRILGSSKTLCNGVTRRDMLLAGGLSLFGLSLPDYLRAQSARQVSGSSGRAKSCILLYLYGAPSQIELADQKPEAPVEIRGELGSIRSSLPGCDVCELLPATSKVMHLTTVVRSLTHPHPIHGVAYATTSTPVIDVAMELNPHDPKHWPYIGSVIAYLEQQKGNSPTRRKIPENIALPFQFSSKRSGEVARAGPYGAFLGNAYNPHYTEFHGTITGKMLKMLREDTIEFNEPYVGTAPDAHFTLGGDTPSDLTLDRLNRRKSLLEQLEDARRTRDQVGMKDPFRELAYSMINSKQVRQALDIRKEPPSIRDSYGQTLFGQSCLAARRLVEAGSKFVTVFWDEYGLAGSGWDTHWDHYNRMKKELMPGFDRGFSGLIADLNNRGMLDDTLVIVLSEHGRTPKISTAKGGGRDHWSQAYSALFAGGGVARGRVVGKTDKIGGTVVDRPISPKDVLATVYHLLGYDLETTLIDRTGRPQPLVPYGQVIHDILA